MSETCQNLEAGVILKTIDPGSASGFLNDK
jgi:hypothetical protein